MWGDPESILGHNEGLTRAAHPCPLTPTPASVYPQSRGGRRGMEGPRATNRKLG